MENKIIKTASFKPGKVWLAFLLSIICPGLGQLYNGEVAKSFIILFLQIFLLLLIPFNIIANPFKNNYYLFVIIVCFFFILLLYALLNSFFFAKSNKQNNLNNLNNYNRIIFYILYFFINRFLFLTGLMFFLQFVSIFTIKNNKMYPTLSKGDVVFSTQIKWDNLKIADCVIFKKEKIIKVSRVVFNNKNGNFSYNAGRIAINGSPLTIGIITANQLELLGLSNHESIHLEENNKSEYVIALFENQKNSEDNITYTFSDPVRVLVDDNRKDAEPYIFKKQEDIHRVEGILYSPDFNKIGKKLFNIKL